jgi:hypothetical protein
MIFATKRLVNSSHEKMGLSSWCTTLMVQVLQVPTGASITTLITRRVPKILKETLVTSTFVESSLSKVPFITTLYLCVQYKNHGMFHVYHVMCYTGIIRSINGAFPTQDSNCHIRLQSQSSESPPLGPSLA